MAGLAAGGGFAAVSSIAGASSPKTSAAPTTTVAKPPSGKGHGRGPAGGFGPGAAGHRGSGFGGGRGFGATRGTITAISGSTLTLRTEAGTETVKTTSSTGYVKEHTTVSFSALRVGEVIQVGARPPSAGTSTPGTGTVTATRIEVVLPQLSGRVTAIDAGVYTLVGADGQLLTVTSSASTVFFNGSSKTTAAAVKVGTRILAEGTQDSLTHLRADTITVTPTRGAGAPPGPGGGRFGGSAGSRFGSQSSGEVAA